MICTIALALIYGLEPVVWIMSMNAVNGASRKRYAKVIGGVGYYMLSIAKQYAVFKGFDKRISGILFIIFAAYIITSTLILFHGERKRKLLSIGVFLLINYWSELFSIIIYILFVHCTIDRITQFGTANLICTIQAKAMLAIGCRIIFFTKKLYKECVFSNQGILPFTLLGTILQVLLLSTVPLSEESLERPLLLTIFVVSQSYSFLLTFYIVLVSRKMSQKMKRLEQEVKNYQMDAELREQARQLRHDMSLYKHMLRYFIAEGQYAELRKYIGGIVANLDDITVEFELDDPTITNTLNILAAQMQKLEIHFEHVIMVSEFFLSSYEISRILWNILTNAIDAVQELDTRERKIFFEIRPEEGGYHINCMNTYQQTEHIAKWLYSSNKKDERNHGRGLKIVKQIVEKHCGIMKITLHPVLFELDCFIPGEGRIECP